MRWWWKELRQGLLNNFNQPPGLSPHFFVISTHLSQIAARVMLGKEVPRQFSGQRGELLEERINSVSVIDKPWQVVSFN